MNPQFAACLSVTLLAACATQQGLRGDGETLQSSAQALETELINGAGLPAKTLILSFDDGPGDRSEELSAYLRDQGIRATFFVTGWEVDAHPGVIASMASDGHRIANHTQTHVDLTTVSSAQVRDEIQRVDDLIAPLNSDGHLFFRPPYFAWSARVHSALFGTALDRYVGPVHADIGNQLAEGFAADWACWQEAHLSSAACAALYMNEIHAKDRGIVLMHDPWGDASGNAVDMVKIMIPQLKAEGYRFAMLEEVPAIAAQFSGLPDVTPEPGDAGCPEDSAEVKADAAAAPTELAEPDAGPDSPGPKPDAEAPVVTHQSSPGTPDAAVASMDGGLVAAPSFGQAESAEAAQPLSTNVRARCSAPPSSGAGTSWLAVCGLMACAAVLRRRASPRTAVLRKRAL